MNWLDRVLIKIAVCKAAARGASAPELGGLAAQLISEFERVDSTAGAGTAPSVGLAGQR